MARFKVYSGASGTVNSTLIEVGEQGLILVDTQASEEEGRQVLNQIGDRQLQFVFNTHEHFDHLGGNALFRCRIISSTAARDAMLQAGMTKGLPNCYFGQQLRLHICGEEVRLQLFGGHSPGSAVMYLPKRRLLLVGDLVFNGRAPWMGQADFPTWIAALTELSTWDVDTVIPGHGPVGGKEILLDQRQFLENFVADVQEWKRAGKGEEEMMQLAANKYAVKAGWHNMLRIAFKRVSEI